mgnify:FL=1|jgi:hypothetical protein|tara:strand:- start:817 stop:1083 length:267 start_codon:yes stop_codon:yes gene_type:complete
MTSIQEKIENALEDFCGCPECAIYRNHMQAVVRAEAALESVEAALNHLHETGDYTDEALDKSFRVLLDGKIKLVWWIKENKDGLGVYP